MKPIVKKHYRQSHATGEVDSTELERTYERGRQGLVSTIQPDAVKAETRREIAAHPKFPELKKLINSVQPGGRANRPAEDYLKARPPRNTSAGRRIDSLQGLICNALGLAVNAGREIDYEKTGAGRSLAQRSAPRPGASLKVSVAGPQASRARSSRRGEGARNTRVRRAQCRFARLRLAQCAHRLDDGEVCAALPAVRTLSRYAESDVPQPQCGLRNSQQRPPVKWRHTA